MRYQKTSQPRSYSVTNVEKRAVALAKKIIEYFPDTKFLSAETCGCLISWLTSTCQVSQGHIIAMLYRLMPMPATPESALRIAYAVMFYLPEFMEDEYKELDNAYDGSVKFKAHCRVLECRPFIKNIEKGTIMVKVKVMLMTSLMAGMVYEWEDTDSNVSKVLRRVGMSGTKTDGFRPPQCLTGGYLTITFGKTKEYTMYPLYIEAVSSEKKKNQELTKLRRTKTCDIKVECYECPRGRNECYLACRAKTKKGKQDVSNTESEIGANDSESSGRVLGNR